MSTEIPIRSAYLAITRQLKTDCAPIIHEQEQEGYRLEIRKSPEKIFALVQLPNGFVLLSVLAPAPLCTAEDILVERRKENTTLRYQAAIGAFSIKTSFEADQDCLFHYRVGFTPDQSIYFQEDSAGVLVLKKDLQIPPRGNIYFDQLQMRSGACFLDFGKATTGNLFYFQDLTTLNHYAEDNNISLSDSVKSQWPEIHFTLPSNLGEHLHKGKSYQVADGYISYQALKPKSPYQVARNLLEHQYRLYTRLQKPTVAAPHISYCEILRKSISDLAQYKGCWQQVEAEAYLNAYVNDYDTPPESMVQLAVLRPMIAYHQNFPSDKTEGIITELLRGLPRFFDKKIGSFGRWLPKSGHQLEEEEEQKKQRIMDSWYLHHPLLNLSFILLSGEGTTELKGLFIESIEFCIRVATHFHYDWPIFYDLDTLDIIKAESEPGDGGERDVAGLYAYLMLRAYELTQTKKYLIEAKRAAKTLSLHGIDVLYQANNTAYAAEALLELWCMTEEERYLQLSEICIASLLRNTALWEQNYGNAVAYPTFFMLFPLKDAPYAALFEEQECVASFNRYLIMAEQCNAPLAKEIYALLPEYCKYALHRLPYYFPPMLPEDILAGDVKTGFIDKNLWIPVEDLGDGRQPVGAVGQEVYGAGAVFQVANYHLHALGDAETFCFVPYPVRDVKRGRRTLQFRLTGVQSLSCPIFFIGPKGRRVKIRSGDNELTLDERSSPIDIPGGTEIQISW